MSDAPVQPVAAEPERRPLTPEASNLLGWWWLAIVFAIVLLMAIWPSLWGDAGSTFGTYVGLILCAALVVLGAWVAAGWAKAQEWSAGAMRITAIVGLVAGVVAVGYFLYAVAFAAPPTGSAGFFGPTPVLTGILWVTIIILPFIFGLLVIFGLMSDAADEWLHPPLVPHETHPSLKIDPATAAMMAGSATAVSHAVSDEALMNELSQQMSIDEVARRKTGKLRGGDESSIQIVGSAEDDLSVQVVGGQDPTQDEGSLAELAALEQALSEDARKKKAKKKGKKEEKPKPTSGDEPLSVDDDFKL